MSEKSVPQIDSPSSTSYTSNQERDVSYKDQPSLLSRMAKTASRLESPPTWSIQSSMVYAATRVLPAYFSLRDLSRVGLDKSLHENLYHGIMGVGGLAMLGNLEKDRISSLLFPSHQGESVVQESGASDTPRHDIPDTSQLETSDEGKTI